jgi:hypothetical protein
LTQCGIGDLTAAVFYNLSPDLIGGLQFRLHNGLLQRWASVPSRSNTTRFFILTVSAFLALLTIPNLLGWNYSGKATSNNVTVLRGR